MGFITAGFSRLFSHSSKQSVLENIGDVVASYLDLKMQTCVTRNTFTKNTLALREFAVLASV